MLRLTTIALLTSMFAIVVWAILGAESLQHIGGAPFDLLAVHAAVESWLNGHDPYQMRYAEGLTIFYYPPWALPMLSPFGLLEPDTFRKAAFITSILLIVGSALLIASLLPRSHRPLAWFLAAIFLPCWVTLKLGQISPLLLGALALSGYLFARCRNSIVGSLVLLPLFLKPHLAAPVYLFVVARSIRARDGTSAFALLGACSFLVALSLVVDRGLFTSYLGAWENAPFRWETPTLAALLRWKGGFTSELIAPVIWILGCCAAVWIERRESSSARGLYFSAAFSVACAPYIWTYDFLLLLPAVIQLSCRGPAWTRVAMIAATATLLLVPFSSFFEHWWFPWSVIACLAGSDFAPGRTTIRKDITS
ncbi:MAG: DUF2029 domain-containing protein [Deltaproteobacteria bacterium]|nr:DUF2029 domain-containing protein [Deltaproteobacteria bacterium]